MPIGELILVSIGKENIYLSLDPNITYFKIAYKRHTNYSIEPIPQYFKSTPNFGRRCTININKNADLLGMSYLCVELPTIQPENFISISNKIKTFAWVEKIGLVLINFIEFEIGGTIIDRHYGDWINIWYEIINQEGLQKSYNKMIGNIPELTLYSKIKKSYKLYIPLCFSFCLDTGIALPLIALFNNDIKIHVDFNDVNLCYKFSPTHYITVNNNFCLLKPNEKFYQIYQNNKIIGEFIYFDILTQRIYYNEIKGKFNIPIIKNDINYKLYGEITKFEINIKENSIIVNDDDFFKYNKPSLLNAFLLVNFIYLDNYERSQFLNNSHEYIIPIVETLTDQIIYSNNIVYKLPFKNPVKMLIWRCILQYNVNNNNIFNYTLYPYEENNNIINKNLLICNSVNRMNLESSEYYTILQKYQYNLYNKQKGIYIYSFCLYPKELHPSGTLNFSKLNDAYLQLSINKNINYQNPAVLRCYSIQYTILKINLGIAVFDY